MWSAVGIVRSYGRDGPGLKYRQEKQSFLFSQTSRQALRPSQPPIHWALEGLYRGKAAGTCVDHSTLSYCRGYESVELYSNSLTVLMAMTGTSLVRSKSN